MEYSISTISKLDVEEIIIPTLQEFKNIKNISHSGPYKEVLFYLYDTIAEINQKQALRCDLMF